jgi:hypothetical protein
VNDVNYSANLTDDQIYNSYFEKLNLIYLPNLDYSKFPTSFKMPKTVEFADVIDLRNIKAENYANSLFYNCNKLRQVNTMYVDGVKVKEAEKNTVNEGFVMLTVGDRFAEFGSQNKIARTLDDFQIFDRALSETEVQALYQNKANTPKYYSWADWKLSQV